MHGDYDIEEWLTPAEIGGQDDWIEPPTQLSLESLTTSLCPVTKVGYDCLMTDKKLASRPTGRSHPGPTQDEEGCHQTAIRAPAGKDYYELMNAGVRSCIVCLVVFPEYSFLEERQPEAMKGDHW